MKWPKLVLPWVCSTPIHIEFEDGLNADGSPKRTGSFDGYCQFTEKARHTLDKDGRSVFLAARVLLDGDIRPGGELSGTVTLNGGGPVYRIYASERARNPDGAVNFTALELM